jgi:hypothetical protein
MLIMLTLWLFFLRGLGISITSKRNHGKLNFSKRIIITTILITFSTIVIVGVLYCRTVNLYRSCVGLGWLAQETSFILVWASEE